MTTTVDTPQRADGLQLLGTMDGSGYRTPPALVRRGDGQTLQLTPLLHAVLAAVDGERDVAEIAAVVRLAVRREVTPDAVVTLVEKHLRPLGLLKLADGSDPALKRSDPLLGLRFRVTVTDPATTRRLTDPFRVLFRPVVVLLLVPAFLAVTGWVFFRHGLGPAALDAFQRPHLLLAVLAVTIVSGGFHEFGHAAAARYGGATPGRMGAGLYLVWPAFYTDVTDSYRLPRGARIRTDLGGLYFNALVVVATFAAWWATSWDALLLLVATQVLQMVQQLMPTLRFDGYHVLADVVGVPDLYQRIRPTLVGLLPHRWRDPGHRVLKPWARAVITLWVLVTVPLMVFALLSMVLALPRLLGTAWQEASRDAGLVGEGWSDGSVLDVAGGSLQVLAVLLPVVAGLLVLGRLAVRWVRRLSTWSRGSARRRAAAVGLVTAVAVALSLAWAPTPGTYRPIRPGEKGLLTSVLPRATGSPTLARPATGAAPVRGQAALGPRLDGSRPLRATFGSRAGLPTRAHPQLAAVLVPRDGAATGADGGGDDEPWVFPFDRPLPLGQGDNEATAVNTRDDSVVYDVAFALVWVTGDEALNVNRASAYASCSRCVTVAVAFQVVLVPEDTHVVVPQNLAVAANYDCYRCITAALAQQLVLSVSSTPGEEQLVALSAVWQRLLDLGRDITAYSLTEISDRLEEIERDIVAILATPPPAAEPTASVSAGPSSGPGTEETGTSASPSPGATQDATGEQTAGATTSAATPAPAPSGSAEPTPATDGAGGTGSSGASAVPEPAQTTGSP